MGYAYLFDMTKVDPFAPRIMANLRHVLTSSGIIKIFHDFCEDGSALINQYGVYCSHVFDT